MERLSRSIPVASTSDQYARQLSEQILHNEQIDEKRRHVNHLYDELDLDTRTRYVKQHHDLERRANDLQDQILAKTTRSEYLLRIWREYELRLDDIRHQLDELQQQLPITTRLLHFEQIQAAFVLYKVGDELLLFSVEDQAKCFFLGFETTIGHY